MIIKNDEPHFHLAGTDFFEKVNNSQLDKLSSLWDQTLVSENSQVYRAEFLAYKIFSGFSNEDEQTYRESSEEEQHELIQKRMNSLYEEGYVKGIHEYDT